MLSSKLSALFTRRPSSIVGRILFGLGLVLLLSGGFGEADAAQAKAKKASAGLAANQTLAACSWDRPGKNPYMGELPTAIDRYTDLSSDVRSKLKDRIAKQQYDDVVEIKRDAIVGTGKFAYAAQIRDMHFGDKGRVCKTVTRKAWKANTTERGLVYCESGSCVLVPTVCRNVSRVAARPLAVAGAQKPAGGGDPSAPAKAADPGSNDKPAAVAAKPDGDPSAPGSAQGVAPGGVTSAPAFADVAQGPVFAFPGGPTGTSSIVVVPPPGGGGGGAVGGTGGTAPPGTTPPGTPTTPPTGTPPSTPPAPGGGATPPPGGVVGGDSVVTPIPEPSTWALMLAGLLAVAWMARRQRRTGARAEPSRSD